MQRGGVDMKGVTQDDLSKLTKAMKDQQFRDHMDEYVKEISDPAHRKEYLEYLDQIEAKGEVPDGQALLRCEQGLCVKTTILFKNGQTQKCFINVVHSNQLDDFSTTPDKGGQRIVVPHVLSPPRPDQDNKKGTCLTCDLAVSTRTFLQAAQNSQILKLLVDTAADGLGSHFLKGFEEVKKDYKVMQRMRCKGGPPMPMSVKAERLKDGGKSSKSSKKPTQDAVTPGELRQMRADAKEKMKQKQHAEDPDDEEEEQEASQSSKKPAAEVVSNRIRVPKHSLVHSGTVELTDYMEASNRPSLLPSITVPKLLRLTVELPTVKQVGDITLEVTSNNVVVEVPNKFYLDLPLSYEVDDGRGTAKFDKTKQVLTLELPVCPKPPDAETLAALERFSKPAGESGAGGEISEEEEDAEDDLPPLEDVPEELQDPPEDSAKVATEEQPEAEASEAKEAESKAPRERLEFGEGSGGALQILQESPAAPDAAATDIEQLGFELIEDDEAGEDFIPSEEFAGCRPGYYFSMGEEGLGYYRDLKQASSQKATVKTVAKAEPAAAEPSQAPLVQEVITSTSPATSSTSKPAPPKPALPEAVKQYVDLTGKLLASVPATAVGQDNLPEIAIEWRQTRQNLVLLHKLPKRQEVSGVHLAVEERRLGLMFFQRPLGEQEDLPWQHMRVRRMLCRESALDLRQWHAEVTDLRGASYLIVTVRKTEHELWDEAFDSTARLPAVSEDRLVALRPEAEESSPAEDSTAPEAANASPPEGGVADDALVADKAAPVGAPVAFQGAGADALKQGAMGMGQAVLLRSRLMYQLL
mmetsp:Transcript_38861/g.91470  ORF Transcript_38861/g.91470 Transcript_38861/m.91470 type:complete len:811 (-) Transcript_38861:86-2518(-)